MTTAPSPAAFLHLLVGYDGSPPASRALDAAALLLQGRTGHLDVMYVSHTPVVADAPLDPVDMERGLDQIEQELHDQATKQLNDSEVDWEFHRRRGSTAHELTTAATSIHEAHPDRFVMVVAGSSSSALHRVAGSVAVSLGRHPTVPVLIVP